MQVKGGGRPAQTRSNVRLHVLADTGRRFVMHIMQNMLMHT